MWEIVFEVLIPKIFEDHTEFTTFRGSFNAPAGRIPSRAQIEETAREMAAQFFAQLHETMNQRPYDYGEPGGVGIESVTFVP
jgi:hypothetical protein